ncbi:MAG: hypothetical protein E3J66_01265 [Dehalococcoidia bacterium]|nr:MAG: hypothetical protein E3J66_01265 [Dehalococcoidia bacterium]
MSGERGGLLSAGGILSIIVGAFEVIGGGVMVAFAQVIGIIEPFWYPTPPYFGGEYSIGATATVVTIIGAVLVILGILAIVGGISAIRRKSFGLSLLGAICALLPINVLGILAVIFVSLGRMEFHTD